MNRILSLALCSALMLGAVASPVHAASVCKAQKSALSAEKKKEKSARKAFTDVQKLVAKLTRDEESQKRRVEKEQERTDRAVTREEERTARQVDRFENQRLNMVARAAELTAQAGLCAGAGLINDLLGSNLECTAAAVNAMIAEATQLTTAAGKLELRIRSEHQRRDRKVESIRRVNARKITTEQQKYNRIVDRLARETAKLPALEARAAAANTALEAAQASLDQCLAIN